MIRKGGARRTMSILWHPEKRQLDLPEDLDVPDDPEDHLALLRPQDGAVANAMNRTLRMRRALLRVRTERRRSP
jgi:hypothetical protein